MDGANKCGVPNLFLYKYNNPPIPMSSMSIKKLLIMRFSAMGDVAMTVPVLNALATQNPHLRITMLTRHRFVPMFEWLPSNVVVRGVDLSKYDGIMGITRLFRELKEYDFDAVADLHDVLRTKYLRACFRMAGTRIAVIDKGRKEKRELTGCGQTHAPLKKMTERYVEVFKQLDLACDLSDTAAIDTKHEDFSLVNNIMGTKLEGQKWIGVAPFAAHDQKVYPLYKTHEVINLLADKGYKLALFGAGDKEKSILAQWEAEYTPVGREGEPGAIICTCGKLGGLRNEMLLMSKLDLMISMDSANMHLASIFNTPVLSIWGATHPKAGFTGFGQREDSILQLDLPCRPCSVYGNKPCAYGDMRCMNISSADVVAKAEEMIRS